MIITKQKKLEVLLDLIKNDPVFIAGCSECATLCSTGGEKEVIEMKENLEKKKIEVTGWVILDPACHLQNDKRLLRKHKESIKKAKKILVLACGNGAQTVSDAINDKDIISGNDTIFLGEIKHLNEFERKCNLCGDCVSNLFGGFCPVSRCPKSMLNGPCGGSVDGKCEVNKDIDCVWDFIIRYFKEKGELDKLRKISAPKDWSKSNEMSWRTSK